MPLNEILYAALCVATWLCRVWTVADYTSDLSKSWSRLGRVANREVRSYRLHPYRNSFLRSLAIEFSVALRVAISAACFETVEHNLLPLPSPSGSRHQDLRDVL